MKKANKRRCPQCGTRFEPVVEWQVYDRNTCRIAAFRGRQKEVIQKAKRIIEQQAGL